MSVKMGVSANTSEFVIKQNERTPSLRQHPRLGPSRSPALGPGPVPQPSSTSGLRSTHGPCTPTPQHSPLPEPPDTGSWVRMPGNYRAGRHRSNTRFLCGREETGSHSRVPAPTQRPEMGVCPCKHTCAGMMSPWHTHASMQRHTSTGSKPDSVQTHTGRASPAVETRRARMQRQEGTRTATTYTRHTWEHTGRHAGAWKLWEPHLHEETSQEGHTHV